MYLLDSNKEVKPSMMPLALKGVASRIRTARRGKGSVVPVTPATERGRGAASVTQLGLDI